MVRSPEALTLQALVKGSRLCDRPVQGSCAGPAPFLPTKGYCRACSLPSLQAVPPPQTADLAPHRACHRRGGSYRLLGQGPA